MDRQGDETRKEIKGEREKESSKTLYSVEMLDEPCTAAYAFLLLV